VIEQTDGDASPILRVRGLRKVFGGLVAVDGVDLDVERGSFHSIIGPNGAGKTTLFNLLSGTLEPTEGSIVLNGEDITGRAVHRSAHLGIGRSFQVTNVFPNLTVLENIRLAVQAVGPGKAGIFRPTVADRPTMEKTARVVERVGLIRHAFAPARILPHGDQRRLELGMILASDPEILLLDEPTAGMASGQVPELMDLIASVREEAERTILLVEHNMRVVMEASDVVTVMHQGRVLAEGTPREVADNEMVQGAYLGTLLVGEG
jgi:branched-chain amino acid transport system ATP-binding protein